MKIDPTFEDTKLRYLEADFLLTTQYTVCLIMRLNLYITRGAVAVQLDV